MRKLHLNAITRIHIFKSLIVPVMTYGSPAWFYSKKREKIVMKFDKLSRWTLRMAFKIRFEEALPEEINKLIELIGTTVERYMNAFHQRTYTKDT